MTRIAALVTCHNRRETTTAAVEAYFACEVPDNLERDLVLVDDGSVDGTSEDVARRFPEVMIERGDGSLFWTRGMLLAWTRALQVNPEFVLWLNDDTVLYEGALMRLLETDRVMRTRLGRVGISVGSTCDSAGVVTYGGMVSASRWNRLKIRKVSPQETPIAVETMNGNCVLVPREVWQQIGLLDGTFAHAMGDNDYGFRAHRAGVPIWVAPGFCGVCEAGDRVAGTWADESLPLVARLAHVLSPKGLPPKSWLTITWRYAGPLWVMVWMWPYVRMLGSAMRRTVAGGRR